MKKILMGKIVNAIGLKGEVKVYNYSDSIRGYEKVDALYVDDVLHRVENVRNHKNMVILKLEGIHDRNDAEKVKGSEVFLREEDLPELPKGQFYIRDLLGMTAIEDTGIVLGKITDVLQNRAQDILEIEKEDGNKLLVPKVEEFVLDIDSEKREIKVRLIEGLAEL